MSDLSEVSAEPVRAKIRVLKSTVGPELAYRLSVWLPNGQLWGAMIPLDPETGNCK